MDKFVLAPLLVGCIFIVAGIILKIFPPKRINSFYGYRTKSSIRNQQTWDVANKYAATLFPIVGIIIVLITIGLNLIIVTDKTKGIIGIGIVVMAALTIIGLTEKRINKIFDREGNAK